MNKAILNPGQDTEFECKGFKRNVPKSVCAHLISILCLGIPYLVGHWKPDWKIRWHRTHCALYYADTVMITPKHGAQYATLRTIAIGT